MHQKFKHITIIININLAVFLVRFIVRLVYVSKIEHTIIIVNIHFAVYLVQLKVSRRPYKNLQISISLRHELKKFTFLKNVTSVRLF